MLYRALFERINFGFEPPLRQRSDVLFEAGEDDNLIDVAWLKMWVQNPHWTDPNAPVKGIQGWSSVLMVEGPSRAVRASRG